MPVNINQNYFPNEFTVCFEQLKKNSLFLLHQLNLSDKIFNILFVNDEEISWLNSKYRQIDKPTNVLSFPFADGTDEILQSLPIDELGDVIISLDTAYKESLDYGQSLHHRLTWLIVHGLLHLIGYDHDKSEQDEKEMQTEETRLLNELQKHRRSPMTRLAINVDHIATIRQARGITEPDPVTAASICELAGAAGIVVHLREDRRHIQDRDVYLLKETVKTKLNLEMAISKEIIKIALDVAPDMVTLVPEKRAELTTEGGLDVCAQSKKLCKVIEKFTAANIPVSLFIDPVSEQIIAAKKVGATFVELHTGTYCDAPTEELQQNEFILLADAAEKAYQMGLRVNAGHGLDYTNAAPIAALKTIEELSIGHSIIGRAVICGLDKAVRDMKAIVDGANSPL